MNDELVVIGCSLNAMRLLSFSLILLLTICLETLCASLLKLNRFHLSSAGSLLVQLKGLDLQKVQDQSSSQQRYKMCGWPWHLLDPHDLSLQVKQKRKGTLMSTHWRIWMWVGVTM